MNKYIFTFWAVLVVIGGIGCGDDDMPSDIDAQIVDAMLSDAQADRDSGVADAHIEQDASIADATGAGDTSLDTVPPASGSVVVVQAHVGRTTRSCDAGREWNSDTSSDDTRRCFSSGDDCDHDSGAARGIAFSGEFFVTTFGWGTSSTVKRSRNGGTWETVLNNQSPYFGGIAAGNGVVLLGARTPKRSTDHGSTWSDGGDVNFAPWNIRRTAFVPDFGGLFLMVAQDGGNYEVAISADGGMSWYKPNTIPSGCGQDVQNAGGIVSGNGVLLLIDGTGVACRSRDAGRTWTKTAIGGTSHPVFDGEKFYVWGGGNMFTSTDGENWSSERTSSGFSPRVTAFAAGTFVGVEQGWGRWYDQQRLAYSDDGLNWTYSSSFRGGHPVRFMTSGASSCE